MQTQDNTSTCYRRGTLRTQWKISPLENQLGYISRNRPSKPNLSNEPKPSKLLAPTRLRRTVFSLASWILQLAHCVIQYELALSWTASQTPRTFTLRWIWWGKDLVYDPLNGMTMKRVRVEEFEESSV